MISAELRLLVVDDDRTLREGCASVLQMDGHNVTSTGRGEEALELEGAGGSISYWSTCI